MKRPDCDCNAELSESACWSSVRVHCLCRRFSSLRTTFPAPRARLISYGRTCSSSSRTVVTPNDCASDAARGLNPDTSSCVSSVARSACASRMASSVSPSTPTVSGVVSGWAVSAAVNTSRQASSICRTVSNRRLTSRCSARRKNAVNPSRNAGSNNSADSTGVSSVVVRGSLTPSPHTGRCPDAISCSVTAAA